MKKFILFFAIYVVLGVIFGLCFYQLYNDQTIDQTIRMFFSYPEMRRLLGLEPISLDEIEEIKVVGNYFYVYFRHFNYVPKISKYTVFAFLGVIITPVVAILFPIAFFIIRKIVVSAKEKASASRVAKEEALYQRFKERMEREKRR